MLNLSQLEINLLLNIIGRVERIEESYKKNDDSINDVIFQQIEVSTSKDEVNTLNSFMAFNNTVHGELDGLFSEIELLRGHFLGTQRG